MGHFYRSLNLIQELERRRKSYILILNRDTVSQELLVKKGIPHRIVDFGETCGDWETPLIREYGITCWINDRMETTEGHVHNVKKNGVKIVTFDDTGKGGGSSDYNIFGMAGPDGYKKKEGCTYLEGTSYLVLNQETKTYRRQRHSVGKILITLGGSDTYGVTLEAVKACQDVYEDITVICGPNFKHRKDLEMLGKGKLLIKDAVPSLIREFHEYDLAITGGGITPFEANSCGLPCVVIANELHEMEYAKKLEELGSSIFAGYYKDVEWSVLRNNLDVETMSRNGLTKINSDGVKRIFDILEKDGQ